MSINSIYHAQYRGDFTATGASITPIYTYTWLRDPSVTDPAVYQATRGSLTIPATATVERAFLTWVHDDPFIDPTVSSLYLRTPASASDQLPDATFISATAYETVQVSSAYRYFSYTVDVTDLVREGGSGDYWVYNFFFSPAYYTIPSKAGWSLYVFYNDDTLPFKDLSYYAGLVGVGPLFSQTEYDIVLTGIQTPAAGSVLGRIGATTYNSTAGEIDSFIVESTPMFDAYTPPDDFANSISRINNQLMDMWPLQTTPADVDTSEFQTKVIALNGTEVANSATQITVRVQLPGRQKTVREQATWRPLLRLRLSYTAWIFLLQKTFPRPAHSR